MTDDFASDQDEKRPCLVVDDLAQYFSKNIGPEISALDESLDDIKQIVDRLLRLTVVFKNPTPHEKVLPMHAHNLINNVSHVQEEFPGIPDHLAERLGMSLLIRRQYFRDREESFNRPILDADHTQGPSLYRPTSDWVSRLGLPRDQTRTAQQHDDVDDISEVITTELRLPPIPKEYTKGPLKCPFCHSVVSIRNRQAWKYGRFPFSSSILCQR